MLSAEAGEAVREAAERHLEICSRCRDALEDLAGPHEPFRALAGKSPRKPSPPLAIAMRELTAAQAGMPADPAAEALAALIERLGPATRAGAMGRLGEYDLLELIEAGGMGIVLRAFDPSLQRVVALKVLYPMLAASPLARQRFVREARMAAAIHHDHVVTIYSVAEARGLPFIVMELVEGESLARRLDREGPLPPTEIVRIGREIASGLAAAHAQGIVHRDLKPANVLLEAGTGRAKLTDFGLARAVDDTGLTRGGLVPGTPEYLAPECAQGRPADARSDLFSLGCVLHAAAAGQSPFRADTTLATLRRVCEATPEPLHRGQAAFPRWLGELVTQLLRKDPARRPASAAAVLALLEREGADLPRERGARALRQAWIVLMLLAIPFAVGTGLRLHRPRPGRREATPPAAVQRERMPFAVFDASGQRLSGHDDIHEAVAALPANGILRLCWDGPRVIPPVTLPHRPASVRRMKGFRPLWVATHADGPALTATAPLLVAGPEFEYRWPEDASGDDPRPDSPGDAAPDGLSLIQARGAELRIDGCGFRADFSRARGPVGFACVSLQDSPACDIQTSSFDAPRAVAIAWRLGAGGGKVHTRPATLDIHTSMILAGDVVWFSAAEDRAARLGIHSASFDGRSLLFLAPELRRATRLELVVASGIFRTDWILIDRRNDPTEALPAWIACVWKPTICRPIHGFIPSRTPGGGPAVATAEGWERFWQAAQDRP